MMRRIALEKELLRQPSLCGLLSSIRPLPLFFRHQSYRNDNGNFGRNSDNSFESSDDFERRLFGDVNNDKISDSFYRKLDKLEKAHGRSGTGSKLNSDDSRIIDGISDSFNSLSDGMDEKLKEAARTFVFSDEIHDENYKFRPDVTFYPGMTYTTRVRRILIASFFAFFLASKFFIISFYSCYLMYDYYCFCSKTTNI
ncbi:hypothetical protein BHE74_00024849 [Ensete ventricosum]|nr:hypothetical protein BHE74_00024849 [Ensete ventricosum]